MSNWNLSLVNQTLPPRGELTFTVYTHTTYIVYFQFVLSVFLSSVAHSLPPFGFCEYFWCPILSIMLVSIIFFSLLCVIVLALVNVMCQVSW